MRVLPENILRCMSAKDRKAIGQCTAAEAMAKWEAKNEKDLHDDIMTLLNLKGIVFFHSTFGKKTRRTKGEPDFLFAISQPHAWHVRVLDNLEPQTHAIAWEIKTEKGALSLEQERLIDRMIQPPNGWRVKVIRSLQEAIKELAELGV